MNSAATAATVRIVRDGMNVARYSIATGAALGYLHYCEWSGHYTVTRADGRSIRTLDADLAHRALAFCA